MGLLSTVCWIYFLPHQNMRYSFFSHIFCWINESFGWTFVWNRNKYTTSSTWMVWWRENFVKFHQCFTFHNIINCLWFLCNAPLLFHRTNATVEENDEEIINDSIAYLIMAAVASVIQIVAGTICVDCFNQAAISQVTRMRIRYFTSLMRQEMGWYDLEKSKSGNFAVRLDEYVGLSF